MSGEPKWALDPEATGGAMAFIQWKGTAVCMDIECLNCGLDGHFCDQDFLYEWICERCGQLHEMSALVRYRAIAEGSALYPKVLADDGAD